MSALSFQICYLMHAYIILLIYILHRKGVDNGLKITLVLKTRSPICLKLTVTRSSNVDLVVQGMFFSVSLIAGGRVLRTLLLEKAKSESFTELVCMIYDQ